MMLSEADLTIPEVIDVVDSDLPPPQDWRTPLPPQPAPVARKQVRAHTNRLKKEQEKWRTINRTLRDEQRELETTLQDEVRAEQKNASRRSTRSAGRYDVAQPNRYAGALSTGLGGAHTRQRAARAEQPDPYASGINPYKPVRIADGFDQLPVDDDAEARPLSEIQARLAMQEQAATAALNAVSASQKEDSTTQAKQLAKQGNQHLSSGDLPAATHSYEKAVAAARAAGDDSLIAVLLASRAEVHFACRDYKSALADAREAAETDPRVVDAASAEMMRAAAELIEDAEALKPKQRQATLPSVEQPPQQAATAGGGTARRVGGTGPRKPRPKPPKSKQSTALGPRTGRVRAPRSTKPKRGPLPNSGRVEPLLAKIHQKRAESQGVGPVRPLAQSSALLVSSRAFSPEGLFVIAGASVAWVRARAELAPETERENVCRDGRTIERDARSGRAETHRERL